VRQIGRELQRKERVVKIEVLPNVTSWYRVVAELKQTTVVISQSEFARRTEHAFAINPSQFPEFDDKRLATFHRWKFRPYESAWHADA
jgi:hypothetical protein